MNDLGEFFRHMRLKHDERMLDMANKLKVSPAFLSAVAHGKKNPPLDLVEKLEAAYELSPADRKSLVLAIDRVASGVRISAKRPLGRETAAVFARKVNGLSDKKLMKIKDILKGEGENDE